MSPQISQLTTPALEQADELKSDYGLEHLGLRNLNNIYWNLSVKALYKEAGFRSEGDISETKSMIIDSGKYKACLVNDKFIVREPETKIFIDWGINNRPFSPDKFEIVYYRMLGFLQKRDLFVQDGFAGADPDYALPIRVITEKAWQSLFAKNMLIPANSKNEIKQFVPEFTIISVPSFQALPEIDGTVSEAFVIINFERKLALIGGTGIAGEIKSAVATIVNFLLPRDNILTLHCSANAGANKDTALFFGDTDKTKMALVCDSERRIIGDDFIGWSDEGIFNIEGGLYTKLQVLCPDQTADRFACTQKFGAILENVVSPNGRVSYPIHHLENRYENQTADHPQNIIILTCDSFGVLPPVSKLTADQAIYHYMSGYSSVINGDKAEINFNTCFGDSLLVFPPNFYAEKLRNKIKRYKANCWLVNTGWSGRLFGDGKRIDLETINTIINAILENKLTGVEFRTDSAFGFEIPQSCDGVLPELLNPANSWNDKEKYKANYLQLARLFIENFKKFTNDCPAEIVKAGPTDANK